MERREDFKLKISISTMMESTTTVTDQQTTPALPINNSSSRRKQSKPNRYVQTHFSFLTFAFPFKIKSMTDGHCNKIQEKAAAEEEEELFYSSISNPMRMKTKINNANSRTQIPFLESFISFFFNPSTSSLCCVSEITISSNNNKKKRRRRRRTMNV